MPPLSPETVAALRRLVQDHLLAYMVDCYGAGTLPAAEIDRLVRSGLLSPASADAMRRDFLEDAFLAGMVLARLEDARRSSSRYTLAELEAELVRNPIALSDTDRRALDWAREGAALNCRHLGERAAQGVEDVVWTYSEERRAADESEIRGATARAVEERRTPKWLRAELGRRIGAYEQDLDRIACTELQDAHNEGAARGVLHDHGPDALVVKIPNPKACSTCRALYLDGDGNPRTFTMAELIGNGTNVGRKRAEWRPVVGTTHPWCACFLRRLPPGFEFRDGVLLPIGAA